MRVFILNRSVIEVSGPDASTWLDGLITNSLQDGLTFAALLTPQGKIIADFFVHAIDGKFLIETPKKFEDVLLKRLKMYKLRAKVDLNVLDAHVSVHTDTNADGFADPRHDGLGHRMISSSPVTHAEPPDAYDGLGLSLSVPDSEWDFETSDIFPADAKMDLLNGVDFSKGCFVGQEVVSRMKRKTEVRKRMRGVSFEGPLSGDKITAGVRQVGDILHVRDGLGMALVRLDRLAATDKTPMVGDVPITIMEA